MNLVEKINQVKIKADTRISGADRAFCERQQRAYDAAREALRELDFTWTDCISQQKMILDGEQAYMRKGRKQCRHPCKHHRNGQCGHNASHLA